PHGGPHLAMLREPMAATCARCHDTGTPAGADWHAHAPVAEGDCAACHDAHRSAQRGLLQAPAAQLCTLCHGDVARSDGMASVHAPAEGSCLDCHLPHGGEGPGFLSARTPGLCFNCHDENSRSLRAAHLDRELAGLDCTGCHAPHRSAQPGLMQARIHPPFADRDCAGCHEGATPVADQRALCFGCHDDVADAAAKVVHAPFADGSCSDCHNAHASRGEHLLNTLTTAGTCAACHDPADLVPDPALAHTPVREGRCTDCHDPHAAGQPALLRGKARELCLGCHAELKEAGGLAHVHAPFADGNCLDCHDPHGGPVPMSLVKAPTALCADCHGITPAEIRPAHRGFPVDRSDCSTCHAPHASDRPGLPHAFSHEPYAAGDCAACHQGTDPQPAGSQMALCLECHPGLGEDLKTGLLHAPLAEEQSCTVCHAPHTAPGPHLLPRNTQAVCAGCHEGQVDHLKRAEHRHPAVGGATCTVCHDPHLAAPDRNAPELKREACLACHSYAEHADHPMGPDSVDPRTGRPMLCDSCHDPHGSAWPKFMHDDPEGRICVGCHTDKLRQKRTP
ncbi:MAG: cytochrome c3 family protein, partial [Krumholzibacteria bacterium]|nr:cytochrome c3 family protein [Candidatus Krumholzibacteria bacterium]